MKTTIFKQIMILLSAATLMIASPSNLERAEFEVLDSIEDNKMEILKKEMEESFSKKDQEMENLEKLSREIDMEYKKSFQGSVMDIRVCSMQYQEVEVRNPKTNKCEVKSLRNGCIISDYNKGRLPFASWEICKPKKVKSINFQNINF
jgi:hypothetical protein